MNVIISKHGWQRGNLSWRAALIPSIWRSRSVANQRWVGGKDRFLDESNHSN
ncbi:hypothetical protein OAG51_00515 [Pirellulaceae bacterium]|nr:hypothetical protein [Pirellulaceae bacterium]